MRNLRGSDAGEVVSGSNTTTQRHWVRVAFTKGGARAERASRE